MVLREGGDVLGDHEILPMVLHDHEGNADIPVLMLSMQLVWELHPTDQWIDGMGGDGMVAVEEDGGEEELMMDVGEEFGAEEDGEISGDYSGATDHRAWTERLG
jgi:hypothetical protein